MTKNSAGPGIVRNGDPQDRQKEIDAPTLQAADGGRDVITEAGLAALTSPAGAEHLDRLARRVMPEVLLDMIKNDPDAIVILRGAVAEAIAETAGGA